MHSGTDVVSPSHAFQINVNEQQDRMPSAVRGIVYLKEEGKSDNFGLKIRGRVITMPPPQIVDSRYKANGGKVHPPELVHLGAVSIAWSDHCKTFNKTPFQTGAIKALQAYQHFWDITAQEHPVTLSERCSSRGAEEEAVKAKATTDGSREGGHCWSTWSIGQLTEEAIRQHKEDDLTHRRVNKAVDFKLMQQ